LEPRVCTRGKVHVLNEDANAAGLADYLMATLSQLAATDQRPETCRGPRPQGRHLLSAGRVLVTTIPDADRDHVSPRACPFQCVLQRRVAEFGEVSLARPAGVPLEPPGQPVSDVPADRSAEDEEVTVVEVRLDDFRGMGRTKGVVTRHGLSDYAEFGA
jgi:hypothetical protein